MKAINQDPFEKSSRQATGNDRESLRATNLDHLISALLLCKENYQCLAALAPEPELRATYMLYAAERANFAATLFIGMSRYGGVSVDENGNITGEQDLAWRACTFDDECSDEEALLSLTLAHDSGAIKQYDAYLRNHIPVIGHLNLLVLQRDTIKQGIKKLS